MNIVWSSRKRLLLFGLPWTFTKYTLTDEKILIDTGFLNQKQEEIRLYRILDISLSRSLMQRMFGLGTITCKTSDKTLPMLEIKNIKDSLNIKEQLSTMVEKERVEKRVYSREFFGGESEEDEDMAD